MGKTLVLAEKPSVARDLAKVLGCNQNGNGCIMGSKYIVTWALGHLVTLADPEAYGNKYGVNNVERGVEFWFDLNLAADSGQAG